MLIIGITPNHVCQFSYSESSYDSFPIGLLALYSNQPRCSINPRNLWARTMAHWMASYSTTFLSSVNQSESRSEISSSLTIPRTPCTTFFASDTTGYASTFVVRVPRIDSINISLWSGNILPWLTTATLCHTFYFINNYSATRVFTKDRKYRIIFTSVHCCNIFGKSQLMFVREREREVVLILDKNIII